MLLYLVYDWNDIDVKIFKTKRGVVNYIKNLFDYEDLKYEEKDVNNIIQEIWDYLDEHSKNGDYLRNEDGEFTIEIVNIDEMEE